MSPALGAALLAGVDDLRRSPDVRHGELRLVEERTLRLRVRDGRPEQVTSGTSRGVGVRVLGQKTWGFACTDDTSEAGIRKAVREAIAIAAASSRIANKVVPWAPLPGPTGTYQSTVAQDPFAVPLEDKIAEIDRPVRALLARGKPIQSAEAWMDWTRVRKHLLSTEGTDTHQTFTYGTCGMQVVAVNDAGEAQRRSYPTSQGGDGFQAGYERVREVDLMAHVDRIADEAIALLSAPPCSSGSSDGRRDVILESSQMGLQIHESCGHPTELDRALGAEITLAGGSFLQPSMLGKLRYGSPLVTLVADATSPGGLGTFGWDDEGVPAGKHPLVHEGLFVDYLSSRETAAALGRASTGTMRADGWNRTPIIRMVNVSLEPGSGTLDDLVADTQDGVLIESNKSWSIDDLRLNFQFSCEIAWEIKHGKRTRILRDPFYTGITPELWRSCDAVCGPSEWKLWGITNCGKGDPMQAMQVGHGAAPARFRQVTVGSSGSRS
jgi:TldD protein